MVVGGDVERLQRAAAGGVDDGANSTLRLVLGKRERRDLVLEVGRVGGDGQQRARRDIARQLAGDDRTAAVPAEHQRPLRAERDRLRRADRLGVEARLRRIGMDRRVVLGDDDRLDALADDQLARRVEVDAALAVAQADQRAGLVGHHALRRRTCRRATAARPCRSRSRRNRAARNRRRSGPACRLECTTMREIRSSASTSCTSAPPTTRATSAFFRSRISAAMRYGSARRSGSLTSASTDLDHLRSPGSSPSGRQRR